MSKNQWNNIDFCQFTTLRVEIGTWIIKYESLEIKIVSFLILWLTPEFLLPHELLRLYNFLSGFENCETSKKIYVVGRNFPDFKLYRSWFYTPRPIQNHPSFPWDIFLTLFFILTICVWPRIFRDVLFVYTD